MEVFVVGNPINLMKKMNGVAGWQYTEPSSTELLDAYPTEETIKIFQTESEANAYATRFAKNEFLGQWLSPVFKVEYTGPVESLQWQSEDISFSYSYPTKGQHSLQGSVFLPGPVHYTSERYATTIHLFEVPSAQLTVLSAKLREKGPVENTNIISSYDARSLSCSLF